MPHRETKPLFSVDPCVLVLFCQYLCLFFIPTVCVFKYMLMLSLFEGEDSRGLIFVACWQNPSTGCRLKNLSLGLMCVMSVCVCLIIVTIFFPIYMAYVSFPFIFLLSSHTPPLSATLYFSLSKNRLSSAMNPVYSPVQPGTPYGNPKNMAFTGTGTYTFITLCATVKLFFLIMAALSDEFWVSEEMPKRLLLSSCSVNGPWLLLDVLLEWKLVRNLFDCIEFSEKTFFLNGLSLV